MRNLTLYNIETELLELVLMREDIAAEVQVTPEGKAEQEAALYAIDQQVAEYIVREVAKVDNLVGYVSECDSRSELAAAEAKRYSAISKTWERRRDAVKNAACDALRATVSEQQINEAKQGSVIKRIRGKVAELKLCKNPPRLDEPQLDLLPTDLQRVTITMSLAEWNAVKASIPSAHVKVSQPEPMRQEIAERLKDGEPVPGARLIKDNVHIRFS